MHSVLRACYYALFDVIDDAFFYLGTKDFGGLDYKVCFPYSDKNDLEA